MNRGHALALGAALLLHTAPSQSCGGFVTGHDESVPSLSVEKVAIFYDGAHGVEHFVREIAFDGVSSRFGFVVPVPARPEVAAVKESPFRRLESLIPDPIRLGGMAGGGVGASKGGPGGGVQVLETKRLGSFAVSVLAASDSAGLSSWLKANALTVPTPMEPWLAHYVELGFHYVVFRYDPSSGERSPGLKTETVRISFPTVAPYYPYLEPAWPHPAPPARVLAVWLVSDVPYVPVAYDLRGRAPNFERPWISIYPVDDRNRMIASRVAGRPLRHVPGRRLPRAGDDTLLGSLGSDVQDLLPPSSDGKTLSVQVFLDEKGKRTGWGDVVMMPELPLPAPRDPAAVTAAERIVTRLLTGRPVPAPDVFSSWMSGRGDWDALPIVVASALTPFDVGRYFDLTTRWVPDVKHAPRGLAP